MSNPLFTLISYVRYKIRASSAHALHSPFVFDLYAKVLHPNDRKLSRELRKLRAVPETDPFELEDPKDGTKKIVTQSSLVKKTASSHKFSLLLYRLINFLQIKNVLETGTSLGINTAYLSQSNAHQIVTIEGSLEIAERAKTRLSKLGLNNVEIIVGRVQEVFYPALVRTQPNLIFLDADHRSETIGFYLQSIKDSGLKVECIVIHDIYWSRDMHAAWAAIVNNPQYTLTIDIFEAGVIFPNYPIEKQHFTLKF